VNPDFTNDPVFPNTVTLAPLAYEPESTGTDPPVDPFPSYVTEYTGVHFA
jgi:hypothetical protein